VWLSLSELLPRTELTSFHWHTLIYLTEKWLRYISCVFTLAVYNMQLRNIGKKSIVCPTNPTVTYCSFSSKTVSCLIKVQFTGKKLVSKILGVCRPPASPKWRPWSGQYKYVMMSTTDRRCGNIDHWSSAGNFPFNTHIFPLSTLDIVLHFYNAINTNIYP